MIVHVESDKHRRITIHAPGEGVGQVPCGSRTWESVFQNVLGPATIGLHWSASYLWGGRLMPLGPGSYE